MSLPVLALVAALATAAPAPGPAPTPLPATPDNLPAASRYELPNGLRVVLIENRAAPWLEVQLGLRVGTASDPVGKEGLASLAGELLTGGVPGLDEQALAEALDRIGATLGAEVDADTFTLGGHVLTIAPADARRFMELFAAVALDATLPDAVVQRQKTLRLAGIQHLVDNPEALADAAMEAVALGGRPESRPTFGTLTAVPTITRDDLVAWRARAFAAPHASLVIAGAIDKEAMLAWVAERFGAMGAGVACERDADVKPGHCARLCKDGSCLENPTARTRAQRPAPASGAAAAPVTLIAIDAPMTQVQWRYGAPNPFPVTHPDWGAFRLGTHVLGGEFNARLNAILRTREGLTYGAYFAASFGGWDSGVMRIQTDATVDALARSIELGVAEYRRMATEPVPADELEATRATLVNGFPFRFETISDVLSQYAFVELADVPWSWLATWQAAIARYDAKAVQAAWQAALAATTPRLVVVGPPSIEAALGTLGLGAVRVVPVQDFLSRGL